MSIAVSKAVVCFVACHGASADHFATFSEVLKPEYDVQIHASGLALETLQKKGVAVHFPFSLENLTLEEEDALAQQIAKTCSVASVVLTDVGHIFNSKVQRALSIQAPQTSGFAYYENLEILVPGEYSPTAAQVMESAEGILFANEKLATSKIYSSVEKEVNFADKKRFGIGYYPIDRAKDLAEKRTTEYNSARLALFKDRMNDEGQKILVYFGGNNEVYFSEAFPAFLTYLDQAVEDGMDLSNLVIVLQQHPRAKKTNMDRFQLEKWLIENEGKGNERIKKMPKIIISNFSSDKAQLFADAAFYYQTTMGPQLVLEGIPTVQIGHKKYEDVLVRNELVPAVTTAEEFIDVIKTLGTTEKKSEEVLLEGIGYRKDWAEALKNIIKESIL